MKKVCLLIFLVLFLVINFYSVKAIINETQQVDKAYKWLENQTRNNWHNLNVLQHELSLLALSYNENLKAQGLNFLKTRGYPSNNPYCWGERNVNNENQCKIKETAIASYVYNEFGLNYSKINEWLLNKSTLFKDIVWFLQADVERGLNATCSIEYDGKNVSFVIKEDKSIVLLNSQSCFEVFNSTWLEIKKECYEKSFKISCDVTNNNKYSITFLYKKNKYDLKWYVSDVKWDVESGDYVDVSVKDISVCLEDCEYEANAIAAYVLSVEGDERYKNLLPFLILNVEDNKEKNSYAWLYLITKQSDYQKKVINSKQIQGFWKNSNFGQFYDTSINAYSLKKEGIDFNETKTKNYLLSHQNPLGFWLCGEPGCEKIRDTALILYVFWPKATGVGPGGPGAGLNDCEMQGGSCEIGCNKYDNFVEYPLLKEACGDRVCCMNALTLSCSSIGGKICDEDEKCINGINFSTQDAPDGRCCVNGSCEKPSKSCSEQNGYICDNIDTFCPSGKEIPASDLKGDEECCEVECKKCEEIGGKECKRNEICSGDEKGKCCFDECIPETCEDIGGDLCDKPGWICDGTVKQSGEGECCIGDCIKSCEEEGGTICEKDEICDGEVVKATDAKGNRKCCIGECKKKKGFPLFLIIIFLIIIIGVTLFFLYKKGIIKKKKEKPKKPEIFAPEEKIERTIPARPIPTMPKIVPRPLPPLKPELPKEIGKEKVEKEEKKERKRKTEEELEKTLKKIRELTK